MVNLWLSSVCKEPDVLFASNLMNRGAKAASKKLKMEVEFRSLAWAERH